MYCLASVNVINKKAHLVGHADGALCFLKIHKTSPATGFLVFANVQ